MTSIGPAQRIHPAWSDALSLFAIAQRAQHLADSSIELRERHLRRFATDTGISPWHAAYETIHGWLQARREAGWSEQTTRIHRSTIRAFYRWAFASQRVPSDPAAEPSRRMQERSIPGPWREPIAAFRLHLIGLGRSAQTVQTRRNAIRRFAAEHPTLDPWEVQIEDLFDWFGGKRWASETRKLHRDALQAFYRWAKTTGRTKRNPAKKLPPIRGSAPTPRPVPDAAYRAALAAAGPRERLALRLAAEAGLRRGEVAVVHSRDLEIEVDAKDGTETWWLHVHGKGGKQRRVPLPVSLAGVLRAGGEGFAFPGNVGGHIDSAYLGKAVSELLPTGFTMHKLRHRFASRVYAIDGDILATQLLLGHASPATTQRYVATSTTNLRRLVEAVAAS